YVKLNNQFVVPVMAEGRVSSLVVLSLSLEVTPGQVERVYEMEPKLRDAMLQVLFDHANSGGFNGSFTDGANLVLLRAALLETALRIFGKDVTDVLIVDIVRQDN
ncbi:MAG: flagellar basal body-associated FliL family protein, partial [Rhodobacter sp.]